MGQWARITIRQPADSTYKYLLTAEFKMNLPANQYVNLNSALLCFPIRIKTSTIEVANIYANIVAVNTFLQIELGKLK